MRNFQGIIFIWIRIYSEIFKSALVYLQAVNEKRAFEKITVAVYNRKLIHILGSITFFPELF